MGKRFLAYRESDLEKLREKYFSVWFNACTLHHVNLLDKIRGTKLESYFPKNLVAIESDLNETTLIDLRSAFEKIGAPVLTVQI